MFRNLEELFRSRNLLWALIVRQLGVRYRGSVLGFLWTFLNPLLLLATYSLVFKYYIRFDHVENYTLFMFAGLLPWIWFSSSLIEAISSISSSGSLITKALFPPQVLPVVSICAGLVNFLLSLPLLVGFMVILDEPITSNLLLVIPFVFLQCLFLLGLSFLFSALNVLFRDVQHIVGSFLTFWFFLCPILYPVDVVPERFHFTIDFNPMAIVIQGYQAAFLGNPVPGIHLITYCGAVSLLLILVGSLVFNGLRERFAECL